MITANRLTAKPLTAQPLTALRLGESAGAIAASSWVRWDATADTYTQSIYEDAFTDLAWDAATDTYSRETYSA